MRWFGKEAEIVYQDISNSAQTADNAKRTSFDTLVSNHEIDHAEDKFDTHSVSQRNTLYNT